MNQRVVTQRCIRLADEAATEALGRRLALALAPGWRIHLSGDLGSGKTRITQAILRALGFTGRVRSPTFTLLEPYELPSFTLYHFDFYRLAGENDWLEAGFDEWLGNEQAVTIIEWPEKAGASLGLPDLSLRLDFAEGDAGLADTETSLGARRAHLRAFTDRAGRWLDALSDTPSDPAAAGGCCDESLAPD